MDLFNRILYFIQTPDLMPKGLDSAPHKEQLTELKSMSLDEFINKLVSGAIELAINLTIAIVVFYIGKFIIKRIHNLVAVILLRRKVDASLSTFILSFIRIVLYFILIVTSISILGIETSSFLALFASAGVAIGMALSGTLQNFAGGVLILLLKPYRIGDYIEAQGYAGTVTEIQIFHTIINTPDNKSIIIPNGGLSTSSINNYSREKYRRISWTVAISYGDDVETARQAVLKMFFADDRIVKRYIEDDMELRAAREEDLKIDEIEAERKANAERMELPWWKKIFRSDKNIRKTVDTWKLRRTNKLRSLIKKVDRSPSVFVEALADSSVNLTIRAWCRTENYWTVFYDYNEKFYNELPQHGISFPFPQIDVHLPK